MHGCACTWSGRRLTEDFIGLAVEAFHHLHLVLLLDFWTHRRLHFCIVAASILMHISLARACQCDTQDFCVFTRCTCGRIQVTVFACLTRPEAQRVLITCILFLADQRDILLGRTECQLDLCLSSYSVPTPPLQAFIQLAPVIPGQGGVWDLDTVSSSSSPSPYQDAVEEEDIDALQVG